MATIVKRRYSYSVGYTYPNKDNEREIRWEVYYDYKQALERKKELDSNPTEEFIIDPNMSVYHYLIKYCNVYGLSNWNFKSYQGMLSVTENYLKGITKKMTMKEVTIEKAKELYDKLDKRKAVSSTSKSKKIPNTMLHKTHCLLRSAFDYATITGFKDSNPFHEIHKPITKWNRGTSIKWQDDYLVSIFDNCDHCYLMLLLHLVFGCHLYVKEALAIRLSDVHIDKENLSKSTIHITNEFNRYDVNVLSKMHEKNIVKVYKPTIVGRAATRKAIIKLQGNSHTVIIPEHVAKMIIMLQERYDNLKTSVENFTDDGLLFCRNDGYPYEIRMIEKEFTKLKKNLKYQM